MLPLSDSGVGILVAAVTLLGLLYRYLTSTYDYWAKRGVPFVKPQLIFGNIKDQILMRKTAYEMINAMYEHLKDEKFGGYFEMRTPVMLICDPELIRRVLITDFAHFMNRDLYDILNFKENPLWENLFFTTGQVWKIHRRSLTPLYSSGRLKGMTDHIWKSADSLLEAIEENSQSTDGVDTGPLMSNFSLDLSASLSFGLEFAPGSPDAITFRKNIRKIVPQPFSTRLRLVFVMVFGRLSKLIKIKYTPKEAVDYLTNMVKTTMDYRKKNSIQRNDFLQLIMKIRDEEESGKVIDWKAELTEEDAHLTQMDFSLKDGRLVFTDDVITAHTLMFVAIGAEILSMALQLMLYELAANPRVQEKLQQDIDSAMAQHDGKLSYESLKAMHYLDLVILERNRLYTGYLQRMCEIPYKIPGTDVVIEKGTKIYISTFGIHRNAKYYKDPYKFIPERFLESDFPTKGTFLPFGDGPRMCIGMRFSNLTMKAITAKIMSTYSVSLDPRTGVPIKFDPTFQFSARVKGGVWVNFKKRK